MNANLLEVGERLQGMVEREPRVDRDELAEAGAELAIEAAR